VYDGFLRVGTSAHKNELKGTSECMMVGKRFSLGSGSVHLIHNKYNPKNPAKFKTVLRKIPAPSLPNLIPKLNYPSSTENYLRYPEEKASLLHFLPSHTSNKPEPKRKRLVETIRRVAKMHKRDMEKQKERQKDYIKREKKPRCPKKQKILSQVPSQVPSQGSSQGPSQGPGLMQNQKKRQKKDEKVKKEKAKKTSCKKKTQSKVTFAIDKTKESTSGEEEEEEEAKEPYWHYSSTFIPSVP